MYSVSALDHIHMEPFEKVYRVGDILSKRGFGLVYAGVRVCDGKEVSIKHMARTKVTDWQSVSSNHFSKCCKFTL